MARPLTAQEKTRYPWASRISDYVPVGSWRKVSLFSAWAGLSFLLLGLLLIYVFTSGLQMPDGIPGGVIEWIMVAIAGIAMVVGFVMGAVLAVPAWRNAARSPLAWSIGSMLPAIIWGVSLILLQ